MGMSDLNQLLRARFQDHEAPVNDSVWQFVQSRIHATPADTGADAVSDLFRDRFRDHESAVDPAAWARIQKDLGAKGTSHGSWSGWAAAVGGVLLVAGGLWWGLAGQQEAPVVTTGPAQTTEQTPANGSEVVVDNTASAKPTANVVVPADQPSQQGPVSRPQTTAETPAESQTTAGAEVDRRVQLLEPMRTTVDPRPAPTPTLVQPRSEGIALVEQVMDQMARDAEQEAMRARTHQQSAPEEDPASGHESPEYASTTLPKIYLPSTFTPNGDGVNDTYVVTGDGFERIRLRVHAISTNQQVFATNTGEAWDGANSPDGYYVVAVEAITPDGRIVTESKVVWLVRDR